MKQLRDDQAFALDELRRAVGSGCRRVMMQAPTGFGKTVLSAAIVESAQAKGKRVLFTVPAIALVDQTVEAFWAQGVREIGVIQAQHSMTDWSKPVQIASVQTLQKRTLPKADVVLIDEAHKWFRFYEKWFFDPEWKDIPIIGLSATPWTRGLGRYYQKLIVAGTTEALIEQGSLSPFRVFAPSHPELTGVRTVAGDYHEGDLADAMNKAPLIADVVQTWLKLGENRPTMCFAVDRAHAKHLQQQFEAAGVKCGYQDAHSKDAERREIRKQFHNGEIKVVCNVGTLTTGVDWDVRCIIFARPTKSKMLFVQIAGRGLRTADGKENCLFLDHSDNHLRLGFVTDIHQDKLDDGKTQNVEKQDRIALPKECSKCAFLKAPRCAVCPNCGFKAEVVSQVEFEDGELQELKKPKRKEFTQAEKQRWFSMLLGVVQQRGYKSGWAANQYKQKFGGWPRGLSEHAMDPEPDVLNYVKHSMIRYAKRRRAETPQPMAGAA
jgi:DNA repair protein RadD